MEMSQVSDCGFVRFETPVAAPSSPSLVFVNVVEDEESRRDEQATERPDQNTVTGDIPRSVSREICPGGDDWTQGANGDDHCRANSTRRMGRSVVVGPTQEKGTQGENSHSKQEKASVISLLMASTDEN